MVKPWTDPVLDVLGHDPRSWYVETLCPCAEAAPEAAQSALNPSTVTMKSLDAAFFVCRPLTTIVWKPSYVS
jgi:hypothetical protein